MSKGFPMTRPVVLVESFAIDFFALSKQLSGIKLFFSAEHKENKND